MNVATPLIAPLVLQAVVNEIRERSFVRAARGRGNC